MMKKLLCTGVWALVFAAVTSCTFLSTGCSKAEETPAQKEDAQKGQADAFKARQGGGNAAPTR